MAIQRSPDERRIASAETTRWGWMSVIALMLVLASSALLLTLVSDRSKGVRPASVKSTDRSVVAQPPSAPATNAGTSVVAAPADSASKPAPGDLPEVATARPKAPSLIDTAPDAPAWPRPQVSADKGLSIADPAPITTVTKDAAATPSPSDVKATSGEPAEPRALRSQLDPSRASEAPAPSQRQRSGLPTRASRPPAAPPIEGDATQQQWSLLRAPVRTTTPAPSVLGSSQREPASVLSEAVVPPRQPRQTDAIVKSPQRSDTDSDAAPVSQQSDTVDAKPDDSLQRRERWLRDQLQIR